MEKIVNGQIGAQSKEDEEEEEEKEEEEDDDGDGDNGRDNDGSCGDVVGVGNDISSGDDASADRIDFIGDGNNSDDVRDDVGAGDDKHENKLDNVDVVCGGGRSIGVVDEMIEMRGKKRARDEDLRGGNTS